MALNEILQVFGFLFMEVVLPLSFVAIMHYKLGKYPKPLSLERNKPIIIWETLILWALLTATFSAIIFSGFVGETTDKTSSLMLQLIFITAPVFFLIPVLYMRLVKKWTLRDFGFRKPLPNNRAIIIFAVFIFSLAGVLPLLNSDFVPASVVIVLFALIQPAFYEEFFFRGVIQGNLERAIGQNKAWIYAGLLFGLAHVLPNYFVEGFGLVPGIFQFIGQTISGWMFGILYMKTRSLYPGMFAHFLTNGTLASIISMIF